MKVGDIIKSNTNPNKRLRIIALEEVEGKLQDLATGEEKFLRIKTIERNYTVDEVAPVPEEKKETRGRKRGKKPEVLVPLDRPLYTKAVEVEVVDGKTFKRETYIGKGLPWVYLRVTKNNDFHYGKLLVDGEKVKVKPLSKSRVAVYLMQKYDIDGLLFE